MSDISVTIDGNNINVSITETQLNISVSEAQPINVTVTASQFSKENIPDDIKLEHEGSAVLLKVQQSSGEWITLAQWEE